MAFDGVPAKIAGFANSERVLIVVAVVPSLQRIEAVPLLNGDSLGRRALDCVNGLR